MKYVSRFFAAAAALTFLGAGIGCQHSSPGVAGVPASGLWDAHTHLSWYGASALDSLAAHGVVGVRDVGGDALQLRAWHDSISKGLRKGPRIFFAGPAIDGPKPDMTFRALVKTPEDARRVVDSLADLGVDFLKTHNGVPPAAYFAVLREARRRGLKVASHLPVGVPAWTAADSGATSIEHAAESMTTSPIYAGYAKDADEAIRWWRSKAGDTMVVHIARTGVAFTPTLVTYRAYTRLRTDPVLIARRVEALEFLKELTGRMYRAGIPILAGSDFASPEIGLVPGQSIEEEVQLLQEAGLTPADARNAAGVNIARWLGATP